MGGACPPNVLSLPVGLSGTAKSKSCGRGKGKTNENDRLNDTNENEPAIEFDYFLIISRGQEYLRKECHETHLKVDA
jgi:hypothetical protein